jgi:hypothetical protein
MNREAAAKKLKMSVRSLQRAVKAGKLAVKYQRGKSGKQEAIFDADDVARYKAELLAVTEREQSIVDEDENMSLLAPASMGDSSRQSQFDAPASRAMPLAMVEFQSVMERIAEALEVSQKPSLEDVQALTVAEAVELSKEPKNRIVRDVRAGVLVSHGNGRARRIRRKDLIEYLSKL